MTFDVNSPCKFVELTFAIASHQPTQDPTRGNRRSQSPGFWGESTPKVDLPYLSDKSLEPFLLTITTRKM